MKGLRSSFIVGLTSCFLGAAVAAEPEPAVRDPLFGLVLPQADVRFERTEPALLAQCRLDDGTEQRSWVFAATQERDGKYLALGGLARTRRGDVTGPWIQNWKGELVRVNGDVCVVIDPPREALMYPLNATIPLVQAVVDGLAADAVVRYAHAFGSRGRFVAELQRQDAYPKGVRLEALRKAIEASPLP